MGGAQAGDGLDRSEEIVEDVAPVAEHVEDDSAAVLFAVVPGGALDGDVVTFENPIPECAADGENPAEEPQIAEGLQLEQAGQPQLVLDDAVFDAGALGDVVEIEGGFQGVGDGLFAVNVFAGGDGLAYGNGAAIGGLGVEVDRVFGVGEGVFEVGGPGDAARFFGNGFQFG